MTASGSCPSWYETLKSQCMTLQVTPFQLIETEEVICSQWYNYKMMMPSEAWVPKRAELLQPTLDI